MNNFVERLQVKALKQGLDLDFSKMSQKQLYNLALKLHEGFALDDYVSDRLFEIAEGILEGSTKMKRFENIRNGIKELENGDINLGDFKNGKELAEYLKYGVVLSEVD